MRHYILMDLDGCLADDEYRRPLINLDLKDNFERYHNYHIASAEDEILNYNLSNKSWGQWEKINSIRAEQGKSIVAMGDCDFIIMTSRPTQYRVQTVNWLARNNIGYHWLLMRNDHDERRCWDVKRWQLEQLRSHYPNFSMDQVVAAFDDTLEVCTMYLEAGVPIVVWMSNEGPSFLTHMPPNDISTTTAKQHPTAVPDILRDAAATYEERNKLYKDNYKRIGYIFTQLFPEGLMVREGEDWNRLIALISMMIKATRYAPNLIGGGHRDSARDACVYSAMLEELTQP